MVNLGIQWRKVQGRLPEIGTFIRQTRRKPYESLRERVGYEKEENKKIGGRSNQ